MKTTSTLLHALIRRGHFFGPAFFSALMLVCLVGAPQARADLLVLNAMGTGSHILRFNATTGVAMNSFSYSNEGLYSMTVTSLNEVFTNSNILGGYDLYRFTAAGEFRGSMLGGNQAGLDCARRGPDGNLYVIWQDYPAETTRIIRVDRAAPTTFVASGSGGMTTPTWMVFGPDGNLYVNDAQAGILRFNGVNGAAMGVVVAPGTGGLQGAQRFVFGPDGRLYVPNPATNSVLRFDGASGAFVDTFVGPAVGGLIDPRGIAFGPDGHLCVTSRGTRQVLRYDGQTGAYLGVAAQVEGTSGDPRIKLGDIAFARAELAGDTAWFDDAPPAGAVTGTSHGGPWAWVTSNPTPIGARSHRTHATPVWDNYQGLQEHWFNFATETMTVGAGDTLFVNVYLHADPYGQRQIMVSWCDGSWNHRAYWGADLINEGQNGTASRRYMGGLPRSGGWVRLEVPASLVGLEGRTVQGMAFSTFNMPATFDRVGRSTPGAVGDVDTTPPTVRLVAPTAGATVSDWMTWQAEVTDNGLMRAVEFHVDGTVVTTTGANPPYSNSWYTKSVPNGSHVLTAVAIDAAGNRTTSASVTVTVNNTAPTPATTKWFDDDVPAGAQTGGSGGDGWNWVSVGPAPQSGTRAHQSNLASGLHEHYFNYASTPLTVAAGDSLFAWVYVDPANPPQEIMLSWFDGTSWEHRAYWGANLISYGQENTASRMRRGFSVPPAGQWTRLAVPASLVGLEGKTVLGMAFTLFDGRATWDSAGRTTETGDVTPAVVRVVAPAANATVSGNVTLSFDAQDDSSSLYVTYQIDGSPTGVVQSGGNKVYHFTWDSRLVTNGTHTITADVMESGGRHNYATVTVTVNNPTTGDTTSPTLTILEPANNATVSGMPYLRARAVDNVTMASIVFKIDGTVIETRGGNGTATIDFSTQWRSTTVNNGSHVFTAEATDTAGNSVTSSVTLVVNNGGASGTVAWVNGAVPAGASVGATGGDSWNWSVEPAVGSPSGTRVHQSNLAAGVHEHYFSGATATLSVFSGDTLFANVYLDPANVPQEIMLSWNDGHWEHRAYWGANLLSYGTENTNGRRYIGPLPTAGQWVRLEVPAALVGLAGSTVQGLSFTLYGGRATWEVAGKMASTGDVTAPTVTLTAPPNGAPVERTLTLSATASDNVGVSAVEFFVDGASIGQDTTPPYSITWDSTTVANGAHALTARARDAAGNQTTSTAVSVNVSNTTTTPPSTGTDTIWFDDNVPSGAAVGGSGGDGWSWISSSPTPRSGTRAHQSNIAAGLHEHSFDWATGNPFAVSASDTLFAWVYLDPANLPQEIMLSWRDSANWEHRAYWGADLIGYGTNGTASRRSMGALPAAGVWTKLTVPASSVGLGASPLIGMSFGAFGGRVTWDATGKVGGSGGDTSPPTTIITFPDPGAIISGSVTLTTTPSDNVGIARVEFAVDGVVVGSPGGPNSGGPYQPNTPLNGGTSFSISWNSASVANGSHIVTAIVYDAAGNRGTSPGFTVRTNNSSTTPADTTPPTVSISGPAPNAIVSGNAVRLSAVASDNVAVASVRFRIDGTDIGSPDTIAPFFLDWNSTTAANGSHTVTAVATDSAGNQTTSNAVIFSVNNTGSPATSAVIWMDSAVPANAVTGSSGGDTWNWVTSNPAPLAGTRVHQSAIATGVHDHFFVNASSTLALATGDTIFVYVYLDPANVPSEIMLSFNDGNWEHRAYWGANTLTYGQDGTNSRRSLGAIPAAGQWVKLEIPARLVGLEGRSINGVSFTLVGGRATWDIVGKVSQ